MVFPFVAMMGHARIRRVEINKLSFFQLNTKHKPIAIITFSEQCSSQSSRYVTSDVIVVAIWAYQLVVSIIYI